MRCVFICLTKTVLHFFFFFFASRKCKNVKHFTAPYNGSGRKRVRAMLIQLGLRLLLAHVQEKEMDKTGRRRAK